VDERPLPYPEGTWFAVPLRTGGYALGVLARATGNGPAFGYFFGPRREVIPSISDVVTLGPQLAVLAANFGDLGLLEGKWPVLGQEAGWDRDRWPLPAFGRVDEVANKAWRVIYSDNLEVVAEQPCPVSNARQLPKDGLSGYGAVEKRLTKLLGG
jgi:hypothetical protein